MKFALLLCLVTLSQWAVANERLFQDNSEVNYCDPRRPIKSTMHIPVDLYPYIAQSKKPHVVKILNEGPAAYEAYLQAIDRAEHTIDMDFYIWGFDFAGKFMVQKLIEKADQSRKDYKEGKRKDLLQIRVILDGYSWTGGPALGEHIVRELSRRGIRIRYYNYTDNPLLLTHRNHRKLLIVDGKEIVTGGRNMDAESFGAHLWYNYIDRDIWVKGPVAASAHEGFMKYWKSDIVSTGFFPERSYVSDEVCQNIEKIFGLETNSVKKFRSKLLNNKERRATAQEFLTPNPEEVQHYEETRIVGKKFLSQIPEFKVNNIVFVTDPPILGRKFTTEFIQRRMKKVSRHLLIENYTFIPWKSQIEVIDSLIKKGVNLEILTNSVVSENNTSPVAILSYKRQKEAAQNSNVRIYNFNARPPANSHEVVFAESKGYLWGVHTKSMVLDGNDVWVSSHNFDPRSDQLNAEVGVYIHDAPEVAKYVLANVRQRIRTSWQMDKEGNYTNGPKPNVTSIPQWKLDLIETFIIEQY